MDSFKLVVAGGTSFGVIFAIVFVFLSAMQKSCEQDVECFRRYTVCTTCLEHNAVEKCASLCDNR